jgi:hypothetical protein
MGWSLAADQGWVDEFFKGATRKEAKGGALLSGKCPRCHHHIDVFVDTSSETHTVILDYAIRRARTSPRNEIIRCNCDQPHDDRPDDETTGCGVYGWLEVGGEP